MKTLSLSLHNRPDYTKILLDHLDRCFDIDSYQIFICCEPTNTEVISMAKNFRTQQTSVIVNSQKLGCTKNIFQCLKIGFEHSEFHTHLEDDTIPGKDYLLYCQYHEQFKSYTDIFSVSGYVNSKNHIEQYFTPNTDYDISKTRQWFTPWGWSTWIDRWTNIIIPSFQKAFDAYDSWDIVLQKSIDNKVEIFPAVARVQNIGAENGTYCPGSEWHKKNQYNEYWIETNKIYHQNFKLTQ
jgi:hypothetical protein